MFEVDELLVEALKAVEAVETQQELLQLKARYLGKKSALAGYLSKLQGLSVDDRKKQGAIINTAKKKIDTAITDRKVVINQLEIQAKLEQERIDVTLPAMGVRAGTLHPITQVMELAQDIFVSAGFTVAQGPEIEDEHHNFEALNVPPLHPARAMHDTFYIKNLPYLLRTHTSPVQVRVMECTQPPIRIVCPGKVFRRDSDATHTPMFHQMEGLVVDSNICFGHLKGTIKSFLSIFFEEEVSLRFRPSYFPFTEPSVEVDLRCVHCQGNGCSVCSGTGWLEVMGAGLVHPRVLKMSNIDPSQYSGFAFGFGIDRLAMLKFQVNDLRVFFENDLQALRQFTVI